MKPAFTANTQILKLKKMERCADLQDVPKQRRLKITSYYFGGFKCDKGKFNPATADTMEKRREKFEEWRNKRK